MNAAMPSFWSAVAMGIGAMVGAGIFALLGQAGQIAGSAVWWSFLAGGVIALLSGYSMGRLGADQVRVMSFVARDEIPLAPASPPDPLRELVTIAVMRLVFPDRLIPASLDIDGLAGLKQRLDAGANVITSLIPPDGGLAGVANYRLDIEEALRTPDAVRPVLTRCGLETASAEACRRGVGKRRRTLAGLRETTAMDAAVGED